MGSGPRNYEHTKVSKPITMRNNPSHADWVSVEEIKYHIDSKKIRQSCIPDCKMKIVAFDRNKTISFYQDKKWQWQIASSSAGLKRLSEPDYPISKNIYIGGSGNSASMLHFDDRWWIVYGITERVIKSISTKIIVLHNVLGDWDPKRVNIIRDQLMDAFTREANT